MRIGASGAIRELFFLLEVLSILLLLSLNSPVTNAQDKIAGGQYNRLDLSTDLSIASIRCSVFQLSYSSTRRPVLWDNSSTVHYSPSDTMVVDTNADHSTVRISRSAVSDSTAADTSVVVIKQNSALTAVLLSAVVPGGGQIYNGSYWKVPIIYGLQAFFVYEWISNNKSYQSFRTQYEDSLKTAGPPPWSLQQQQYLSSLQGDRDSYHDQRDSYAWYIVGVYALSILDAYVDAELSGFDVSPSLGFAPNGSASAAISVRVKF